MSNESEWELAVLAANVPRPESLEAGEVVVLMKLPSGNYFVAGIGRPLPPREGETVRSGTYTMTGLDAEQAREMYGLLPHKARPFE